MNIRICIILLAISLIENTESANNRALMIANLQLPPVRTDCLITFVQSYMKQSSSRMSIFLMGTNNAITTHYLLKLQEIRPTYVLTDSAEASLAYGSFDALMIVSSSNEIENATLDPIDFCSEACRYGILMTNVLVDEESFMKEANKLVELLWIKRIARVVILGSVNGTLFAAQSQSFRANESMRPTDPIPIGECSDGEWMEKAPFFAPMKMNSTKVHFAVIEKPPYNHIIRNNNVITDFIGIESFIIKSFAEIFDFQMSPSDINRGQKGTTMKVLEQLIDTNKSIDFGFGALRWVPTKIIDFAVPYEVVPVVFMIPIHTERSFFGLVLPFGLTIWLLVIATFVVGGILKHFLFKKMSFLEIIALILGASWYKKPTILHYRIKYISWVLFGFFLTQIYLGSLAGDLLTRWEKRVDTLQELLDSGMSFGGKASHLKFFDVHDDEKEGISITRMIHDKFILLNYDEYQQKLQELKDGKNSSFALVVVSNMSSIGSDVYKHKCYKMKETLASAPLAFAARKGLHYLTDFNKAFRRFIEGGIVSYIAGRTAHYENTLNHSDGDERADDLKFDDMAPIFLILIIGYIAGSLCLVGEIMVDLWMKRNRRAKPRRTIRIKELKKARRVMKSDEKN